MIRDKRIGALIPAAGSGTRMGGNQRKQYMMLKGREILEWTLCRLLPDSQIDEVKIIVPEEDVVLVSNKVAAWQLQYGFSAEIQVIAGGETRQASVYNGLSALKEDVDYVVIHDGVRPFAKSEWVEQYIAKLENNPEVAGIIAGTAVTDTLKSVDQNHVISGTVDRSQIWAVQTPQIFKYKTLKKAHEEAFMKNAVVTDDAAILELSGHHVIIEPSDPSNIKITKPFDLVLAEVILNSEKE